MGVLYPQATVGDVMSEFNISGSAPVTLFNVSNITSGQIYDKITEANATLQGWVGLGNVSGADAAINEAQKRFETNYAAARLAADMFGIVITEGFNYSVPGLSMSRTNAQNLAYSAFIDNHLKVAKMYITMLHQWFFVYNSDSPGGVNEYGSPVNYWSVSHPRYG